MILTFEKLCVAFELTPNDLLVPSAIWREMSFRKLMLVMQIRCFYSLMTLLVSRSALNAEGLWNGNTSLTATATGNAWIGMPSPKQRLSCLRNNSHGYIFSHTASALYPLAAFGISISLPQFFLISLLTFYLQTFCQERDKMNLIS